MARCQLLHDEWGHCEVGTSGDIHDLRAKGTAVRAVMDGYGCVDMCLNHGEFKDAVLMLKDLCKKLEGILTSPLTHTPSAPCFSQTTLRFWPRMLMSCSSCSHSHIIGSPKMGYSAIT